LRLRGCDIGLVSCPGLLLRPALFFRSMTSHPVSRFARYHDGSQGSMKQLRLAGSFMTIPLASLGWYHDGPKGFMKQLRLAGSFMAISHAPVSSFARRFSRSPRLPVLTSLGDLAWSLASLGDYHDGHLAIPRVPVCRFARRLSRLMDFSHPRHTRDTVL